MQTTRRAFVGAIGAATAVAAASRGAKDPTTSSDKVLFYVAAATPCDKNLKFDDAVYRDMMSYFKESGADEIGRAHV